MAKILETYNPQKIEIIRRMLEKQSSKSIPLAYEIFVDNFKVVMKTTDLSEFDSFEDVMTNETRFVRINIFNSPSENIAHTKYVFEVEEVRKPDLNKGLGEVADIQSKIKESIEFERERWDKDQLLKELDRTKHELQEAEEYIDELQSQLDKSKLKPNHLGKIDLGLLAGSALEGMFRRNPHWLTKMPGLEGLAGMIDQENREGIKQPSLTEDTEASFTKQSNSYILSEEELSYISFGKQLAENFDNKEIALLDKIICQLGKDTSQIKTVAELLGI